MNESNVKQAEPQLKSQKTISFIDFTQLRALLVKNWKWLVVSVLMCVCLSFVYLWFTPSTVTVVGKMEIVDKSKNSSGMSAGLAMLNSLPMGLGSSLGGAAGVGSVDSEKEKILSTSLVRNVVKELNLYTEYRLSKWGKKTLLYQNNPIEVSLDEAHVAWLDAELPLYFHQIKLTIIKDEDGYTVEPTIIEGKEETDLPSQTFASLPASLKTEAGILTFKENTLTERQFQPFKGSYTLDVTITPPTIAASSFIGRTGFEPPSKKVTNIVNVSLTDENLMRGIDYVNHLVDAYNQRANDEKNEEALKTDEFVNARLAKIDSELGSSDAAWENSKKNFQITDPEVDAQEVIEKKSVYESQLVSIGTELQLHDYLSDYVNDPANLYEIIPSGISSAASTSASADGSGASSGGAGTASLLAQHNSLVNQRKDLLKSVSEMSPQIQRVNESIKELHPVLKTALRRDRQAIIMRQNTIQREYGKYMGKVNTAPQMERVLTEIGRQREIKQGVYLLMLQKREETAMELANTTDKGKLIDPPAADPSSSKPQKKMVFLVAVFLGMLLPIAVLYILQMVKLKIGNREELEAITKYPVLGELNHSSIDDDIRTLRTNLMLNLKADQKTLLIVSANDNDGKTFIAKRLEESLKAINKKVSLINCDLRSSSQTNGIHPSDVLASNDFIKSISEAKATSDYVILDTPSINKHSDAYQLVQYADATLYVVKADSTNKSDIESLNNNKNIHNALIVFNV